MGFSGLCTISIFSAGERKRRLNVSVDLHSYEGHEGKFCTGSSCHNGSPYPRCGILNRRPFFASEFRPEGTSGLTWIQAVFQLAPGFADVQSAIIPLPP